MPLGFKINGTQLETNYVSAGGVNLIGNQFYVTGQNSYGELGTGDTTTRQTFIPLSTYPSSKWTANIIMDVGTIAIKNDNTLWAWGYNGYGGLGLGDTTGRSSPVQVGTLSNWLRFTHGTNGTVLAVKTDGTLWAWGYNPNGGLGLGDISNRSSPTQVGTLTNWARVSANFTHTLAVKTDGTLWAWGAGANGQIGNGFTSTYSSPIQIGSLTNWADVCAGQFVSYAIKTDGTLWSWGFDGVYGNLGLGTSGVSTSSPAQVGTLTNWKSLAVGRTYNEVYALKTDGTLWAWGQNVNGKLGVGDNNSRSSPTQVGALTNWAVVSSGSYNAFATKTDGTLWWIGGRNTNNQYEVGLPIANIYTSSPVQLGSLTSWSTVAAGRSSTLALYNYPYSAIP